MLNDGEKYQEMRLKETFQCVTEGAEKYLAIRRWSDVDYSVTCFLHVHQRLS